MLFACVVALAWWARDLMALGIIAGIMLMLSSAHFIPCGGKAGFAAALYYNIRLASTCAIVLVIFNLRFERWAAVWYRVRISELHAVVPTWIAPMLTLVLALLAGMLLVLTRRRSGAP